MNKIILPDLSFKIMGALFNVHNELGPTLLEKYYQRALAKELKIQDLPFIQEVPVALEYKGNSIGKYFLDFIVNNQVVIETKAQGGYKPSFFKQTLAYLRQTGLPLAILVNFRCPKLEYRRIINYTDGTNNYSNSANSHE
jgi:GxxExxY protein